MNRGNSQKSVAIIFFIVEEYLRRAHSKERLMDDDRGSSVPSQFDDQLQRTREAISRSRQHLDQIEEIEVRFLYPILYPVLGIPFSLLKSIFLDNK